MTPPLDIILRGPANDDESFRMFSLVAEFRAMDRPIGRQGLVIFAFSDPPFGVSYLVTRTKTAIVVRRNEHTEEK